MIQRKPSTTKRGRKPPQAKEENQEQESQNQTETAVQTPAVSEARPTTKKVASGIDIKSTDRVTLSGLPDSGKTILSKYLAALAEPRVLIYDPLDQYDGFPDSMRYVPKNDSMEEFEEVCRKLCSTPNMFFVIEEAERYIGQGKPLGPYAFDLINRGRNWGIGILAVTRRIQRLSKDYFDLCRHVFFFRQGLRSYDYVKEMVGPDAVTRIHQLEQYHFLHYDLVQEQFTVGYLSLPHQEYSKDAKIKTVSTGTSLREV